MNVRLNDIEYFLAVMAHGRVRAAAEALGVSQPAVTQGIQRLEKEFGFELFERSAAGMRPTGVARQFRDRMQSVQDDLTAHFLAGMMAERKPDESYQELLAA